jgi:hypothetical protein
MAHSGQEIVASANRFTVRRRIEKAMMMKTKKVAAPKKVAKDGPFPMKDGPFPLWTRLPVAARLGKDAPFPLVGPGLYWERVPFETIYQGNRGPKIAKTGILRSSSDQASQLPDVDLGNVDFDREEVIFVGLGARPSNGYMVQISQILYLTDRGPKFNGPLTVVDYSEYTTAGKSDVETYPLHIIKLRKLEGTETQFSRS